MPSVHFACFIRSVRVRWARCSARTNRTAIGSSPSSSSASICRPSACTSSSAELEQLIAAELDHPVIAAPRAAGIEGVTAYLAQDYVTAESLDIVIREDGAPPVADALSIVARLADALDYAADRQIVHGSLHPRDVLLSPDDFRLVGLGIARALERVGVRAPVRRPYTAPERIGGGAWDRRADIFSLAAIAYELVWGRRLSEHGCPGGRGHHRRARRPSAGVTRCVCARARRRYGRSVRDRA